MAPSPGPREQARKGSGLPDPGRSARPDPLEETPAGSAFAGFRRRIHRVIFKADTTAGRAFDFLLVWAILLSVAAVLLESVAGLRTKAGQAFYMVEWGFAILFSIEYALRLSSLRHPFAYARSFFGIVDILSFLPSFLSLFIPGAQAFTVVRVFRILRLFRIFKLVRYMREARILMTALRGGLPKIIVFLTTVIGIVICMGALMYLVEGEANGFTSMPKAIYWAVSTLSTVGYGDMVPKTPAGQAIAAMVMLLGYAILAVPTGIVSVEIASASRKIREEDIPCPGCGLSDHDDDAAYCKRCSARLTKPA
jgi:voltage-gated potassium channel